MPTLHLFFQKVCCLLKKTPEKVSGKFSLKTAAAFAAATALTIFTFVLPGAGAEVMENETDVAVKQEAMLLTGKLLEKDVQKRIEADELMEIQAEEAKTRFLQWEEERKEAEEKARQEEEKARQEEMRLAMEKKQEEEMGLAEEKSGAQSQGNEEVLAAAAISKEDYNTLLKIVEAEAGVCDDKGRILVANVILNRVESGQFPGTVTAVVYQPSQFSPVGNGFIDQVQVSEKTKECVNRALAGEDYSQGALYFMNRGKSQKKAVSWFDSRLTYLFEHGGHEFFK